MKTSTSTIDRPHADVQADARAALAAAIDDLAKFDARLAEMADEYDRNRDASWDARQAIDAAREVAEKATVRTPRDVSRSTNVSFSRPGFDAFVPRNFIDDVNVAKAGLERILEVRETIIVRQNELKAQRPRLVERIAQAKAAVLRPAVDLLVERLDELQREVFDVGALLHWLIQHGIVEVSGSNRQDHWTLIDIVERRFMNDAPQRWGLPSPSVAEWEAYLCQLAIDPHAAPPGE